MITAQKMFFVWPNFVLFSLVRAKDGHWLGAVRKTDDFCRIHDPYDSHIKMLHLVDVYGINVGIYASPMDPMGDDCYRIPVWSMKVHVASVFWFRNVEANY